MLDSSLVLAVIDDDSGTRRLLQQIAKSSGDVVVEASTFREGRLVLREYPWDVAVIDRRLPGGDGLDLCRDVVSTVDEHGSHRHIVFLSAADSTEERLQGFEAGADAYIGKPVDATELRALLRAIRRVVLAQKALLARLVVLEQLSVIDGLTQVYNHRFFKEELRRLFDISATHRRPLSLAMIDLDHFKQVNDSYGHRAGDLVLSEVSTAIAQNARPSDVLGRYGGDEFALLLPEMKLRESEAIAERLRAAVEGLRIDGGFGELRTTISIGVAAVPSPDLPTAARFTEAADRALYIAKEQGRNRVRLHGASVSAPSASFFGKVHRLITK